VYQLTLDELPVSLNPFQCRKNGTGAPELEKLAEFHFFWIPVPILLDFGTHWKLEGATKAKI